MTQAWVVAGGVLATLLSLVVTVVLVQRFRRHGRIAAPEEAADAADAALAGFRTIGAVVGSDGAAALVVDAGDRVAVCRRRGNRITVRELGWNAIRATEAGLVVDSGERASDATVVAGVNALDVRRLRGQDERSRASASAI